MEENYERTCTAKGCTNVPYHDTATLCRKHFEARSTWLQHEWDEKSGCWVIEHVMNEPELRSIFYLWNDRQARTDRTVTNDPFKCRFRGRCVNPMHIIEMTQYEVRTFA